MPVSVSPEQVGPSACRRTRTSRSGSSRYQRQPRGEKKKTGKTKMLNDFSAVHAFKKKRSKSFNARGSTFNHVCFCPASSLIWLVSNKSGRKENIKAAEMSRQWLVRIV